jgi:hypothetical protein
MPHILQVTVVAMSLVAAAPVPGQGLPRGQAARAVKVPSSVRGFVGGESHDTYRIDVQQGERLVVRIAWRAEGGNRAEATVSTSATFEGAEPLPGGRWSADGREWEGTIEQTGMIYVYVVAHPSAHYTLTVRRNTSRAAGGESARAAWLIGEEQPK